MSAATSLFHKKNCPFHDFNDMSDYDHNLYELSALNEKIQLCNARIDRLIISLKTGICPYNIKIKKNSSDITAIHPCIFNPLLPTECPIFNIRTSQQEKNDFYTIISHKIMEIKGIITELIHQYFLQYITDCHNENIIENKDCIWF